MKIGIVPMSGKPVHAGHFALIKLASKENDEVHLFVSTSDRDSISGEAMKLIWETELEKLLPSNVVIEYGGQPVRKAYEDIAKASNSNSKDEYAIYSDEKDSVINFPESNFKKYAPNCIVKNRPVQRTSTIDISGTKMREFLSNNDKNSFIKYLPKGSNGDKIWKILTTMKPVIKQKKTTKQLKTESLLKLFVKNVLRS